MYAWHQQCDRQELCGSSGAAGRNNWNDPVAAGDFKSAVCIGNHRYCQCRGQRRTSHRCGCSAVQHWPHFQVFDTLNYWFQARLQSKYSAIAELVSYAAMSVYKIILLVLGKSVEWFAVASALDYIVLAVFLLIAYFKNGGTRFRYSLKKAKELLQSSGSFIIAGLMVSIYACTDKLMLKQMLGADAVGHYSLASTVSVSWAFILSAIIDSLYPEIVQSFQKDRLRYERKNRQLYAIVFMCPCSYPQ